MTYEERPAQPILLAANPGTILKVYREASTDPITVKVSEESVVAWQWAFNDELDEYELAPIVLAAGRGYLWRYPESGPEVLDVTVAYQSESLSETPVGLHPSWEIVSDDDGEESAAEAV